MRTVTVKDFADAVRKNGYKQAYGAMFRDKGGDFIDHHTADRENEIESACAVGQARINLGWVDDRIWHDLMYGADDEFLIDNPNANHLSEVVSFTIGKNDIWKLPLDRIADLILDAYDGSIVIAEID